MNRVLGDSVEEFEKRKMLIAGATLLVAIAVAFAPPPEGLTPEAMKMLGVVILALVYWATECVPIPVTGLVIITLIALWGLTPQVQVSYGATPRPRSPLNVAVSYIAADVNILILAGLVIAAGLSKHSVDRYLALKLLRAMGEHSDRIVLGVMLSVAAISMWIPNTAAAAIMVPVAVGMLNLIGARKGESNLGKAMMIGVAYAASIGGIGTPVGTPPVPITISNVKDETGIYIGFATWMAWGVPLSLVLVFVAWFILTRLFKPEVKVITGGKEIVEKELAKIGGLVGERRKALMLFLVAVALWLMDPIMKKYVTDWTYFVSLVIIVLFLAPGIGVLSWRDASREVDWGTLFLVAGGLALGDGLRVSGLVDVISKGAATQLSGLNPILVLSIVGLISSLAITVFCSITATSSAMVPVSIGIAKALGLHPAIAAITSGVASCFAFLLPANTPPNAIAYSYGYFKSYEMAKAGIILIVVSVLIALPFALLLAPAVLGVGLVS
ncbi:MAG: DASS family sodium-coupled anion symporter [Desulfurococcaceae archaeon]